MVYCTSVSDAVDYSDVFSVAFSLVFRNFVYNVC